MKTKDLPEGKQQIVKEIQRRLHGVQEIAFAYIFGSFPTRHYRKGQSDIDLAIYFKQDKSFDEVDRLAEDIRKVVQGHPKVDIIQMQKSNLVINHQIFKYGLVILDKDEDLHLRFFIAQQSMYIDLKRTRSDIEAGLKDSIFK